MRERLCGLIERRGLFFVLPTSSTHFLGVALIVRRSVCVAANKSLGVSVCQLGIFASWKDNAFSLIQILLQSGQRDTV